MLDILFIIGLPRSGTSLVHSLIHSEETGRKAPTFRDFGIDLSKVPRIAFELNRTLKDETSLAEDSDFNGTLQEYRKWLETRGDKWVCKSPDHIAHLPELMDVFPEARFLWCIRPADKTYPAILDYYLLTGVGPNYEIINAVKSCYKMAEAFPEKFDCIFTPSILPVLGPNGEVIREGFESNRIPKSSPYTKHIDDWLRKGKGVCRNVTSNRFKEYYS